MKIQLIHTYLDIISLDNLLLAWSEFIKGKKNKKDVMSLNFKYAYSNSKILGVDLKQIKQDSNDATKVFGDVQR